MALGLIGKKIGMTHMYSPEGEMVPVTVIQAGPCAVTYKKTQDRDGYTALQLGFKSVKPEKLNKPQQGHLKKIDGKAFAILREFRCDETESYSVGDELTVDMFAPGEKVEVSGTSKGKGFAGVIKRWGFSCGPMAHGSKFHRAPGSTGMSAWPAKVLKGKKMPGHLGNKKVSMKRLEIIETRQDENIIFVKGAIPGANNGIVTIRKLNE
ncbi:50S ribosomal protein L3 [Thermodesulfobacteriota bacterium]